MPYGGLYFEDKNCDGNWTFSTLSPKNVSKQAVKVHLASIFFTIVHCKTVLISLVHYKKLFFGFWTWE